MKRTMTIVVALLGSALMLSAVATAAKPEDKGPSAKKLTQERCQGEKKADKAAFKAVYGKRAMRTCKKGTKDETRADVRDASQECRAERDADEETFNATYGTNKNGKNAFGKCVSSKSEDAVESDVEDFDNAAKECKAERAEDPEGFTATYGTNKNGKNAFGKCVSSKSEEGDDEPVDEEPPAEEEPPTEEGTA